MKRLTTLEKIGAALNYYKSFSDNAILRAAINEHYQNTVDIFTPFGNIYIMIDEQCNTISVHTGMGCHGCVELSKHIRS